MKIVLGAIVLAAVSAAPSSAAGLGWYGAGPRVGVSSDPDQVFGGAQFDLGEFTRNLRLQPSVELGVGDDRVTLYGNFMTAWYFPVKANVTPYAGAQVTASLTNFDNDATPPNGDDTDTQIGLGAVGGIETRLKSGTRFLAELQVKLTDFPDVRVLVGWTFGKGTPPPVSR